MNLVVVAFAEGIANLAATTEKPVCQTPESRLGSNCQLVTELHTTRCGNRICRPGEGNVKGYTHSTQPYMYVSDALCVLGSTVTVGTTSSSATTWSSRSVSVIGELEFAAWLAKNWNPGCVLCIRSRRSEQGR